FFRSENLAALRELAVRELMHARRQRRYAPPFARILVGVRARERDAALIERMGRLATRLGIALRLVHVRLTGATPDPAVLTPLVAATRAAQGQWQIVDGGDPAEALVSVAGELDVVAIESARGRRRLFGPRSIAARLLRAGCREMLVLAPRGGEPT